MKSLIFSNITAALILLSAAVLTPNIANARTSVYIDLPGISLGVSDRQYRDRYYNNRYRSNRYQRYYYSPVPRTTIKRTYRYNNYYQPSGPIYSPGYQSEICPEPGYSANYYQGHGCRKHYDHYHCE